MQSECINKSGFPGVRWNSHMCKWQARIRLAGKQRNLGLFDTPQEAHQAFIKAKAAKAARNN